MAYYETVIRQFTIIKCLFSVSQLSFRRACSNLPDTIRCSCWTLILSGSVILLRQTPVTVYSDCWSDSQLFTALKIDYFTIHSYAQKHRSVYISVIISR